ncbi:MAG: SpoIIE family protein phosphatase [Kiritimatiellae bacterium]|nr:SpoIIE family protein phosphatase [Kiritimatiellia bacterium]
MSERDDFSTTMRIDITAHMPETSELQASRRSPPVRLMPAKTPVKSETQLIGGKDFHELLQNLYDGAIITRLDGTIANANVRALCFFNFSKSEICGKRINEIILGADSALLTTIMENLKNNQFTLIQAFCIRKDESVFPAEISVNRLHLSNADYLSFFVRDITLRREAEDQLRTGYNAIQNSANGIAIADLNANMVYYNFSMRSLLGLQDGDTVKHNLREYMEEESILDDLISAINRRECWRGELKMRRQNQTRFYVNTSVAPNINADGETTGMVISLVDVSEQKAAQEQLEHYARELSDRNRQMEDDLLMAREIQEALLPREYPVFAPVSGRQIQFAHVYFPSGEVGGDFFNVFRVSEHEVGLFVCDVMGHGMRAALVVATIRGLIEQLSAQASDPGVFLTHLNNAYNGIFEKMKDVTFATVFYGMVNVVTGEMRYVSAGHPPPVLLNENTGDVTDLDIVENAAKGPAIGLFDQVVFHHATRTLRPDELLVIYTDGLSEEVNLANEYYENKRMKEFLSSQTGQEPQEILRGLAKDALVFSGNREYADDVCLVSVKLS